MENETPQSDRDAGNSEVSQKSPNATMIIALLLVVIILAGMFVVYHGLSLPSADPTGPANLAADPTEPENAGNVVTVGLLEDAVGQDPKVAQDTKELIVDVLVQEPTQATRFPPLKIGAIISILVVVAVIIAVGSYMYQLYTEQERIRQEEEEQLQSEMQEREEQTQREQETQRQQWERKERRAKFVRNLKLFILFVSFLFGFVFSVYSDDRSSHRINKTLITNVTMVLFCVAVVVMFVGIICREFPIAIIVSAFCAIICGLFVTLTFFSFKESNGFVRTLFPFFALIALFFANKALRFCGLQGILEWYVIY